jgi:tellurite resistance protein TerC
MFVEMLPWIGFIALVVGLLALDLGVFHRDAHVVERREALIWSGIWIGLALLFNIGIFVLMGRQAGIEWFTGYLVEKSLAVDNIFVILLIFSALAVPAIYQHRVLFWGIIGAIVMRAILILFAGVLLDTFHFIIYVFGAFLIVTAIRFLREKETHAVDINDNRLVKWVRARYPMTEGYEGQKFFVKRNGIRYATPLLLALVMVEFTDLVFAVDSIPAIYAVTDDPFIVFTSNIFAILGLRSLYFVLAGYLAGLKYLKPGLAGVLLFVGAKMILIDVYKIPALISLAVIITILGVAIGASIRANRKEAAKQPDLPAVDPNVVPGSAPDH